MGKSQILAIKIISDSRDAQKGLNDTATAAERFSSSVDKAVVPAAGIATGLLLMAKTAGDAASTLQQNLGAVDTVFGSSAEKIKDWGAAAATTAGLSKSSYAELAAKIGGSLKVAGYSADDMATKTNDLITIGADLASVFGGTSADAVDALGSAFRGEFDPLERFGIFLKQSQINSELAANGQDKLTGSALAAAQKQATLALITDQAATYTGNFAKESDTAAGAQQRANAQWDNAIAQLGTSLLPLMVTLSTVLSNAAQWISENEALVTALAIALGVGAGAILLVAGAIKTWEIATTAYTAVQWLLNAALDANPIGVLIVGIAALVAAFVYAYNNIEDFRNGVNAIFASVANAVSDMVRGVQDAWNAVADFLNFSSPDSAEFSATHSLTRINSDSLTMAGLQMPQFRVPSSLGSSTLAGVSNYYTIEIKGELIDQEGSVRAIAKALADLEARRGGRIA